MTIGFIIVIWGGTHAHLIENLFNYEQVLQSLVVSRRKYPKINAYRFFKLKAVRLDFHRQILFQHLRHRNAYNFT